MPDSPDSPIRAKSCQSPFSSPILSTLSLQTENKVEKHAPVPPIQRMNLETWMWKTHKIRIRGGEPSKLRLSTPYYLQKKDIDRFLETFDEYKREKSAA
jgi:selenocysteine lyase/cysteine desulfurase